MINKKKKKGFTLIELIAVIAILAILGVILVPKLSGYTTKANRSTDLTNAKGLVQAVELYNTDHPNNLLKDTDTISAAPANAVSGVTTTTRDLLVTYLTWPNDPKTSTKAGTAVGETTIAVVGGTTLWTGMTITTLREYATALETPAP